MRWLDKKALNSAQWIFDRVTRYTGLTTFDLEGLLVMAIIVLMLMSFITTSEFSVMGILFGLIVLAFTIFILNSIDKRKARFLEDGTYQNDGDLFVKAPVRIVCVIFYGIGVFRGYLAGSRYLLYTGLCAIVWVYCIACVPKKKEQAPAPNQ